MGVEQEAAVRAFIADLEGEQLDAAQIERAVNRMTPDAEWHVVAWHDPFVGHDAIAAGQEVAECGVASHPPQQRLRNVVARLQCAACGALAMTA